jgi:hypothetical protein
MQPTEFSNPDQSFPDLNFPPFQVRSPSAYAVHGDELLADKSNILKNFADIYGAQFFQARDDIILQLTKIGEDSKFRSKLGKVKAAKFEKFAALSEEQRAIAVHLTEEAMNQLIDRVAQAVSCDVRNYPGGYWIEFEIKAVVYKILGFSANGPKLKKVAAQVMTGDPKSTLASSFGRWLNKFTAKRPIDG